MQLVGATIIDNLFHARGRIVSVNLDTFDVAVMWRKGQVVGLRLSDIQSGRYSVRVAA